MAIEVNIVPGLTNSALISKANIPSKIQYILPSPGMVGAVVAGSVMAGISHQGMPIAGPQVEATMLAIFPQMSQRIAVIATHPLNYFAPLGTVVFIEVVEGLKRGKDVGRIFFDANGAVHM